MNCVIAEMLYRVVADGHVVEESNFPPYNIGDCEVYYRSTIGGCWRAIVDPEYGYQIRPCDEDPSCCLTPMEVCKIQNDKFSVAPTSDWSVYGPPPDCPELDDQNPLSNDECRNVCGWYIYIPEMTVNE